jgi:hypothetical protein
MPPPLVPSIFFPKSRLKPFLNLSWLAGLVDVGYKNQQEHQLPDQPTALLVWSVLLQISQKTVTVHSDIK